MIYRNPFCHAINLMHTYESIIFGFSRYGAWSAKGELRRQDSELTFW